MITDRIEHRLDLFEGFVISCRIRPCETDGTREIAFIGDLDDRETGMLLMIRTDTTVMRTAMDRLGRERITLIPRLIVVLLTLEVWYISRDQYFLFAMVETVLEHEDFFVLKNDLRIDSF